MLWSSNVDECVYCFVRETYKMLVLVLIFIYNAYHKLSQLLSEFCTATQIWTALREQTVVEAYNFPRVFWLFYTN